MFEISKRRVGRNGPEVSAIGLGCMGMSEFYGSASETESIATIHRALDLGVTLLDTSDIYGPFTNERLVGRAIAGRRDDVVLATKFGVVREEDGTRRGIDGSPEYIRKACEASQARRTYAASPRSTRAWSPLLRSMPNLVASCTRSRRSWTARPTRTSLWPAP